MTVQNMCYLYKVLKIDKEMITKRAEKFSYRGGTNGIRLVHKLINLASSKNMMPT